MTAKMLLILLDGVPYRNWRRLFGNLEGWVASKEARVWRWRIDSGRNCSTARRSIWCAISNMTNWTDLSCTGGFTR